MQLTGRNETVYIVLFGIYIPCLEYCIDVLNYVACSRVKGFSEYARDLQNLGRISLVNSLSNPTRSLQLDAVSQHSLFQFFFNKKIFYKNIEDEI